MTSGSACQKAMARGATAKSGRSCAAHATKAQGSNTSNLKNRETNKELKMTHQYATQDGAIRSSSRTPGARLHPTERTVLRRSVKTGALCALLGLASPVLVAPTGASAAPSGAGPFAPGSIVVSQGGTIAGTGKTGKGTTVEANGEVNVYPPGSNGDVAPEASLTKGMYGPFTVVFDPSGDLWADNVNTATLVEITKAQLAMPNPAPAVTISSANFYDMAFDGQGDLWAASNKSGGVYEYLSLDPPIGNGWSSRSA